MSLGQHKGAAVRGEKGDTTRGRTREEKPYRISKVERCGLLVCCACRGGGHI